MFKIGDRVKLIIPYWPLDWSYEIYYGSRRIGNDELLCTLRCVNNKKYMVEMYDKYVVYDEKYYRKQKLEKICSKLKTE